MSGRSSPAICRRIVVLPAPDGPNSTSIEPGAQLDVERRVDREAAREPLLDATQARQAASVARLQPYRPLQRIGGREDDERHDRAAAATSATPPRSRATAPRRRSRSTPSASRPGRLPPTISTTPNSPSVCAKLSTMPVTRPRTDSGSTTRRNVVEPRHAERPRRLEQPAIDRRELRRERLHRERHRIQHRRDQQPLERERQPVAGEARVRAADRAQRTDRDEHVEPEDRRRQHERQRDDRLDEELPPPRREHDPVRERDADRQQHQRRGARRDGR